MKFLLDQSADARLVPHLVAQGHNATRVGKDYPGGLPDARVLAIAHAERRVLITDDRDFGELVFRQRQPHNGVILLRLGDYADLTIKIERLEHVFRHYADQLDQFIVVSQRTIRVRGAE